MYLFSEVCSTPIMILSFFGICGWAMITWLFVELCVCEEEKKYIVHQFSYLATDYNTLLRKNKALVNNSRNIKINSQNKIYKSKLYQVEQLLITDNFIPEIMPTEIKLKSSLAEIRRWKKLSTADRFIFLHKIYTRLNEKKI